MQNEDATSLMEHMATMAWEYLTEFSGHVSVKCLEALKTFSLNKGEKSALQEIAIWYFFLLMQIVLASADRTVQEQVSKIPPIANALIPM